MAEGDVPKRLLTIIFMEEQRCDCEIKESDNNVNIKVLGCNNNQEFELLTDKIAQFEGFNHIKCGIKTENYYYKNIISKLLEMNSDTLESVRGIIELPADDNVYPKLLKMECKTMGTIAPKNVPIIEELTFTEPIKRKRYAQSIITNYDYGYVLPKLKKITAKYHKIPPWFFTSHARTLQEITTIYPIPSITYPELKFLEIDDGPTRGSIQKFPKLESLIFRNSRFSIVELKGSKVRNLSIGRGQLDGQFRINDTLDHLSLLINLRHVNISFCDDYDSAESYERRLCKQFKNIKDLTSLSIDIKCVKPYNLDDMIVNITKYNHVIEKLSLGNVIFNVDYFNNLILSRPIKIFSCWNIQEKIISDLVSVVKQTFLRNGVIPKISQTPTSLYLAVY